MRPSKLAPFIFYMFGNLRNGNPPFRHSLFSLSSSSSSHPENTTKIGVCNSPLSRPSFASNLPFWSAPIEDYFGAFLCPFIFSEVRNFDTNCFCKNGSQLAFFARLMRKRSSQKILAVLDVLPLGLPKAKSPQLEGSTKRTRSLIVTVLDVSLSHCYRFCAETQLEMLGGGSVLGLRMASNAETRQKKR